MSSAEDSPTITNKKVASEVSQYIWDSPCLKPLIFNPFILALLILLLIWVLDFLYGKKFFKGKPATIAQHMAVSYVIIASSVAMNNVLIKHKYRCDKYEEKKNNDPTEAEPASEPKINLIADYIDE